MGSMQCLWIDLHVKDLPRIFRFTVLLSKVLRFWVFVFLTGSPSRKQRLFERVLTNQRTYSLLEFESPMGDTLECLITIWIDTPSPWKYKWDPPKNETEIGLAEKYFWVLELILHLVTSEDFICAYFPLFLIILKCMPQQDHTLNLFFSTYFKKDLY